MSRRPKPSLGLVLPEAEQQSWKVDGAGELVMGNIRVSDRGMSLENRSIDEELAKLQGEMKIEELEFLERLGEGNSSVVQKAWHPRIKKFLAVKKINLFDRSRRHQIVKELLALSRANCPHLVKFYGAFFKDGEGSISIALELMDAGALSEVLAVMPGRRIPEPELAYITAPLLEALNYLRQHHQIHRDIKPANIVLNHSFEAKLSDFGITTQIEDTIAGAQSFVGCLEENERILDARANPIRLADIAALGQDQSKWPLLMDERGLPQRIERIYCGSAPQLWEVDNGCMSKPFRVTGNHELAIVFRGRPRIINSDTENRKAQAAALDRSLNWREWTLDTRMLQSFDESELLALAEAELASRRLVDCSLLASGEMLKIQVQLFAQADQLVQDQFSPYYVQLSPLQRDIIDRLEVSLSIEAAAPALSGHSEHQQINLSSLVSALGSHFPARLLHLYPRSDPISFTHLLFHASPLTPELDRLRSCFSSYSQFPSLCALHLAPSSIDFTFSLSRLLSSFLPILFSRSPLSVSNVLFFSGSHFSAALNSIAQQIASPIDQLNRFQFGEYQFTAILLPETDGSHFISSLLASFCSRISNFPRQLPKDFLYSLRDCLSLSPRGPVCRPVFPPAGAKEFRWVGVIVADSRHNVVLPDGSITGNTSLYMSPERIMGQKYGYSSDIWSLALSILEAALGRYPFTITDNYLEMMTTLVSGPPPSLPPDSGYSKEFADFLAACFVKDPEKRATAESLLQHPWILKFSKIRSAAEVQKWFEPYVRLVQQRQVKREDEDNSLIAALQATQIKDNQLQRTLPREN